MNKLRSLLLCAGLLAPLFANAGVIYEWRTFTTSSSIYTVVGHIELSQGAVQAGRVDYQFQDPCGGAWDCSYADASSPLMRFRLSVNHYPLDIDIRHGTGFLFGPSAGALNASFDVGAWRLDGLSIYANTGESHVMLAGELIADANSDMLGCPPDGCNGATGAFFRVPEPGSAALLGAGMLALLGLRRRRHSRA
jgi:hypothetical protein